jgi:hypothetical protein
MYLQRQPGSFQGWIIFASLLETRRSYHCAQYAYTMALSYLQAVQTTPDFAVAQNAFVSAAIDRCRVAMASSRLSLTALEGLIRNASGLARDRTIDAIALIKVSVAAVHSHQSCVSIKTHSPPTQCFVCAVFHAGREVGPS